MAVPQGQKKKARAQKKVNQKVPKQPKQRKQQRRKQGGRRGSKARDKEQSSSVFVSKILQQLCQDKTALPANDNEKTVFAQRCFLKSQDGQQQCFLSNYVSSRATCSTADSHDIPTVTVWPNKPAMTNWTATMRPPQPSALPSPAWPEGQQQYLFSDAAPSQAFCGQLGTLRAKEMMQYEAHERMPRQSLMRLFASNPSIPH